MTNLELQQLLKNFPDDLPIKIMRRNEVMDFTEESYIHTADSAYVNEDAPEEEWDAEDGRVELGNGQHYLLLNPIIY